MAGLLALIAVRAFAALWDEPGALEFADEMMPPRMAVTSWAEALPRRGQRLASGDPFTILAVGDSVTATGPYPEILARMLKSATGNENIRVVRAAYPGKGVDAALRRWWRDGGVVRPDLALIMFGLNDQAAGASVAAYREQMVWLVEKLRNEDNADVVLLEPTPHINITSWPGMKVPPPPDAAIFRTTGFGAALRQLGAELGVPVARTFDALWGEGGVDLQTAARRMWPLYPRSYDDPFSSLVETGGRGDTIHPNVQGHLALAKAVFATLRGDRSVDPLSFAGETQRRDGRWVSRLTVTNSTGSGLRGRLAVYPFNEDDQHDTRDYDLGAGRSIELEYAWPGERAEPFLQVVDYRNGGCRVQAVWLVCREGWRRERLVAIDGVARLRTNAGEMITVPLPRGVAAGRIALRDGGELAYVRYARADTGEVVIDGMLDEWGEAESVPVGEPHQARSVKGAPRDLRASPEECYLRWSFREGREGVFLSFRAWGEIANDRMTVLFDPREQAELGTVGPYYWIDGVMKPDGAILLKAGDSSPTGDGLHGVWRAAEGGATEAELFVPYAVMRTRAWPESGDLGLSLVWMHRHPDGQTTRLVWSEEGYAWTPRWFGVVRRGQGELPWMVRIK